MLAWLIEIMSALLNWVLPTVFPRYREPKVINGRRPCIVLTGASSGIGFECAARLIEEGFVILASVRRREDGDRLMQLNFRQRTVPGRAGVLLPVRLDIRNEAEISALADLAEFLTRPLQSTTQFPRLANVLCVSNMAEAQQLFSNIGPLYLHAVIQNAGVVRPAPIELHEIQDVKNMFATNVFGPISLTQALLPLLRRDQGRVVVISSLSALVASPLTGVYSASKAALERCMDGLRMELRSRYNVSVSIVQPGVVKTPIFEKAKGDPLLSNLEANPYRDLMQLVPSILESSPMRGVGVDAVYAAVQHALVSPFPKTRYPVGTDAYLGKYVLSHFPGRLLDFAVETAMRSQVYIYETFSGARS